jgi:methionyl-tRNA formyltransferase
MSTSMEQQNVCVAVRLRPLSTKEGGRVAWRRTGAGQIQQHVEADAPIPKALYCYGEGRCDAD